MHSDAKKHAPPKIGDKQADNQPADKGAKDDKRSKFLEMINKKKEQKSGDDQKQKAQEFKDKKVNKMLGKGK